MCGEGKFFPLALTLTALTLAACGPQDDTQSRQAAEVPAAKPPAAAAAAILPAPSWQEAANAAYTGVFDDAVVLTDAQWQGEPFVEGGASAPTAGLVADFLLSGDLDGDGAEEAVVLLWSSSGGSGTFDYVAVLDRDAAGAAINRATAPLGDRVKIRSAAIEDGRAVFGVVQAGPEDAACCPGQKMRRTFVLEGNALTESGTEDQGRMSLADLAGEWSLLQFGAGEALPADLDITAQFEGERIAGSAGCNRYSGGLQEGAMPGEVVLAGPLAVTRMMCPLPLMDWEQRYLQALEGLSNYSFMAGNLVLIWRDGDAVDTLIFGRSTQQETTGEPAE